MHFNEMMLMPTSYLIGSVCVMDNCHFQRNGNEIQYKHSITVMSKLKETRPILENLDVNTQKVVAAKEKIC